MPMSPTSRVSTVFWSNLGMLFLVALFPLGAMVDDKSPRDGQDGPKRATSGDKEKSAAPPVNALTDALSVPADLKTQKRLEAVQAEYLRKGAWKEAAQALQAVLATRADVLIPVRRQGPDKRETVRWASARAEADRLLQSMPAEGLKVYRQLYGPDAQAELKEARNNGNIQLLTRVALRYFHTDAGAEAADLLGAYYLDHGQPMTAALWYARLINREGADQMAPQALLKATLAFR
jgi:hypothetical protein